MSIQNLPTETMLEIFKLLNFSHLQMCGEVCSNWKTLAREVINKKWKALCKNEFPEVYEIAYEKATLSWEELYSSLRSWSQVKSSKVYAKYSKLLKFNYVPTINKDTKKMHLLSNGTIGFPFHKADEGVLDYFVGTSLRFNCISYYDATSLQLINNVEYDFEFDIYEETDDLIVLRSIDIKGGESQVYIYTKPEKLAKCIKKLYNSSTKFYLIKNKVFYITADCTFWMSELFKGADGTTLECTGIAPPEACKPIGKVHAVSCSNDKDYQVKVLTEPGDIYLIADKKVTKLCRIETKDRNVALNILQHHSFFWNAPEVYNWLCTKNLAVTHLKHAVVYSYFDRVIIVGTSQRVLHIYYNPYRKGQLKIFKVNPTLRIDLNGWVPINGPWPRYASDICKRINQIEVVEIKDGHRIILLYCQRLVAIELRSRSLKRPSRESVDAVGMSDGDYTRII